MGEAVKRKYDSSRRKEQARLTRRAIVQAAYDLFVEQGYGSTTMGDIAATAGVAVETVYAAFGSKVKLLRRVWDVTIGGDDEDVPFHERPEVLEMRAEPNNARRLEMYASLLTHQIAPRTVPLTLALRGAASAEPEAREMLEEMDRQRLQGMAFAAADLVKGGTLAVPEDEARDVLWATNVGDLWHHLVVKRGWERDRFARWLADLWKQMLLTSEGTPT